MKRRPRPRPTWPARALLAAALALCQAAPTFSQTAGRRLVDYADPFVGTENGGNIVPGAQVPFGFVHLSPDTERPTTAGYNPYENITGFSQTHVSGTGGASKYGNFLTTPHVDKFRIDNLGSPKAEETASPGYYSVRLTRPEVRAELTATRLVAFHRYTFPASSLSHLLIDVSSVVQPETGKNAIKNPHPVDCWVRVIAPNRIEGSGNFVGGWNQSPYTIHFSAEFSRPFAAFGTWRDERVEPSTAAAAGEGKVGAYATFDTTSNRTVLMKVGVSFISPEKARENLLRETPAWDFDAVRRRAEAAWEDALGKIKVEGGTEELLRVFYTALFHCHYMPHDLAGENAWCVVAVRRAALRGPLRHLGHLPHALPPSDADSTRTPARHGALARGHLPSHRLDARLAHRGRERHDAGRLERRRGGGRRVDEGR